MTDLFLTPREAAQLFRRRSSGTAKWWIAFIIAVLIGIGMNCLAREMVPEREKPKAELTDSINLVE